MSENSLPAEKDDMDTTKFLSIAGTIALYIGLLFDFGYFSGFEIHYFALLSYKDHLAALAFFAVPCLFLAFLFGGFRDRIQSDRFDVAMCSWIGLFFFVWSVTGPLVASMIPPVVAKIAFVFRVLSAPFLIAYLTALILYYFDAPKGSTKRNDTQKWIGLVFVGLALVIMMFGSLWYRAEVGGSQFETQVTLAPDGKTVSRPQDAHIVRAIDGGIFMVLQDAPDRVVFVKKEAVVMLSKKVGR